MRWLPGFALVAAAVAALAQKPPVAEAPSVQFRGVYAAIDMRPARDDSALESKAGGERPRDPRGAEDQSAHMPPVLYALANALAEDDPDDAVFWYHVGRIRAVYDSLRCRDTSARVGVVELGKALSVALRGAQVYQRGHLVGLAQKAIDWDVKNPRNYDQRWIALYGKVARSSPGADPAEILLPEAEWPKILEHVQETHMKSVHDFANVKR